MKMKRLIISLLVGALSGLFCIYWTYLEMSGSETTTRYLLTIFYNRLLIGLAVAISDSLKIFNRDLQNSVFRGALIGAIISVELYSNWLTQLHSCRNSVWRNCRFSSNKIWILKVQDN